MGSGRAVVPWRESCCKLLQAVASCFTLLYAAESAVVPQLWSLSAHPSSAGRTLRVSGAQRQQLRAPDFCRFEVLVSPRRPAA
eukprot:4271946-Alexandrium_andersonii.AAC.1